MDGLYDLYLEEERKHNALALAVFDAKKSMEENENEESNESRTEDQNI